MRAFRFKGLRWNRCVYGLGFRVKGFEVVSSKVYGFKVLRLDPAGVVCSISTGIYYNQ